MTVYDSKMEYLLSYPDPHMFYMFNEFTSLYKCIGEQLFTDPDAQVLDNYIIIQIAGLDNLKLMYIKTVSAITL
jgi:hypothetical protein